MSESIRKIKIGKREIIILGTAHISKESVEEVEILIKEEKPDRVCIEIDESRYKSLTKKSSWSDLNLSQVLKQGKGFLMLANLVLSSFQKRLGLDIGVKPGQEMMTAINIADELKIPYDFCDREIHITLKRAWAKTGFWGKNKMLAAMLSSIFVKEKLDPKEIEKLKEKSVLQNMLEELSQFLPTVKNVLIDERDRYLATNIFNAKGNKIVAVVGAGHVDGIINVLKDLEEGKIENDLSTINIVPPKKLISKILPWLIPVIVVGLFVVGFFRGGAQKTLEMFFMWVIVNGALSSLGALIALAHPLTIILAFIAAPITSLNPTIGVGIFTGLLEYTLRKPKVNDFEKLNIDITTIKGFYKNKFTHILVVFFLSSIGSVIGTYIGIPFIISIFSGNPPLPG